MKQQKNYKQILANYIKWNSGLFLIVIGIIAITASHFIHSSTLIKVAEQTLTFERISVVGEIILAFGSAIFTIGLTIIIIEIYFRQYQEYENEFFKRGIINIFNDKKELQEKYSYNYIVSKYNNIVFIGTRHYELTEDLCSHDVLVDNILAKKKEFKMEIYFLSPNSKHTLLFEQEKGIDEELLLPDKILYNIYMLLKLFEDKPGLKSKISIYLYDSVPIGNISLLDNEMAIINRYNFFENTQKTFWFVLNKEAAKSQRLTAYYKKVIKGNAKPITSVADLKQYKDKVS
jgi:hypothetical protein